MRRKHYSMRRTYSLRTIKVMMVLFAAFILMCAAAYVMATIVAPSPGV